MFQFLVEISLLSPPPSLHVNSIQRNWIIQEVSKSKSRLAEIMGKRRRVGLGRQGRQERQGRLGRLRSQGRQRTYLLFILTSIRKM